MSDESKQFRSLWLTALALLALLAATLLLFQLSLGRASVLVALSIAAAKAGLVALNFMHLRTSTPLMRLFAGAGLLWLVILIGLTAADVVTRQPITP